MHTKKFKFNKQFIGEAIVRAIGKDEGMLFYPYRIKETNIELPEDIYIELEFVPKGAKVGEYPHIFKESE